MRAPHARELPPRSHPVVPDTVRKAPPQRKSERVPANDPIEEDEDDLEDLLEDAPDDLDDEDELLAYFGDRLGIDDDAITELAKEAAEDAGIIAALALLDLFSAGWEALDDAQADAEEAQAAFEGRSPTTPDASSPSASRPEASPRAADLTERLNDIASDMSDELSEKLDQDWGDDEGSAITSIAEINVQSDYSESKFEADEENGAEFSQYIAEPDACDVRQDCHGTILPSDDPWWEEHEPDNHHPNCKCLKVPLSAEDAQKRGGETSAPDVEGGDWKDKWPPDVSDRPDVLAGIYRDKIEA